MGLSDEDREALGMRPVRDLRPAPGSRHSGGDEVVDALFEAMRERRDGSPRRPARGKRGDGLTGEGLDFRRLGGGSDE